jgi:hypothetical protein
MPAGLETCDLSRRLAQGLFTNPEQTVEISLLKKN